MTFATGTVGVDAANDFDKTVAAKAGAKYVVRYSAGAATATSHASHGLNAFKLCRAGEINDTVKAGMDFVANDEWYEDRTYEGATAARQDAPVVLDFWQSMGLAKGATIMLNLDTHPNMGRVADIQHYIDAYNSVLNGYYVADGFYAGIPMLNALAWSGHCKHAWIPEGPAWSLPNVKLPAGYAPPAVTEWDLWNPLKSQITPAINYLRSKLASNLQSCIWQNRNKWPAISGDEDLIVISGPLGSHLDAQGGHVTPPAPRPNPPAPAKHSPYHGQPWPGSKLHFGANDHFGNINGPATSHGGYYAAERPYVKMIQQQLIYGGFVPGHTNPNDGWADGIYDIRGQGTGGPTTDAVTRFQKKLRPHNTSLWGQVWSDDWATLFSL